MPLPLYIYFGNSAVSSSSPPSKLFSYYLNQVACWTTEPWEIHFQNLLNCCETFNLFWMMVLMSGNWDWSPPKLLIQSAAVPLPCLMKGGGGTPDSSYKESGALLNTLSKMNKRGPTVRSNTWGKLPGCQPILSKALGCASQNNYSVGFM